MSLLLLFLSAFGAATLLPLQSEAVLAGLTIQNSYPFPILLLVASSGNVLGSCLNWYLGQYVEKYKHRSWFPVSTEQLKKAQLHYARYGSPTLLLSWVPVIGDPITLMAGVLKEPFWRFLLLVSLAKTARFLFVMALAQHWI